MDTGERGRERLAWVGYVAYVAVVPALAITYAKTRWQVLPSSIGVVLSGQVAHLLVEVAVSVVAHATRNRVPYMERLPTEQWASLLALPVSATVGATAGAVAVEWPRANWGWVTAVGVAVFGLVFALGVPVLAAARAALERNDELVALYDPDGDPERQMRSAEKRWDYLAGTRRWFLARRRLAWLGTLEAPAARTWPKASRRFGQPRYVIPAATVAAGVVTGAVANVVVTDAEWTIDAFVAPSLASLAALTLAVHVFRLTTEEQAEANRLRRRAVELRERLAENAAPAPPEPRGRVRRAWRVLLGRE